MKNKACGVCGYTLSKFYETGMLGCPACYAAFKAEITASLKNIQGGNTRHRGRVPCVTDKEILARYKELLSEMRAAEKGGRLSEAAELSVAVSEFKTELKNRGIIL